MRSNRLIEEAMTMEEERNDRHWMKKQNELEKMKRVREMEDDANRTKQVMKKASADFVKLHFPR